MTPKVSVVIPTRNSPETVRRALESIRRQDMDDYEVLVMDDGSTADVQEQYRSWWGEFDDRFRLDLPPLPNLPGQRQSATRNRGIRLARGEFLAFLDHDDRWSVSDYLSGAVRSLESARADYHFGNMVCLRGETVAIPDFFYRAKLLTTGPRILDAPAIFEVSRRNVSDVLRHHCVHVNTTVLRRELALQIGGFIERLHYYEDLDFMLRAIDAAGKVVYRPDAVAEYTLPESGSLTLAQTRLERALQGVYACQNARTACRRPESRQAARSQESWRLRRDLAVQMSEAGRYRESVWFTWQGVAIYPTLGGLGDLLRSAVRY